MSKTDHIVLGSGSQFLCMHCGGTFNPFAEGPVDLGLLPGLTDAFKKRHAGCKKPKKERCYYCQAFGHTSADHVNATTKDPRDWLECGDTGKSSRAIWTHMMGGAPNPHDYPLDPDDFGRCYRLLHAPWAMLWRARIGEMARYGGAWAALVGVWEELEALYQAELPTGRAPQLYAKMRACCERHER